VALLRRECNCKYCHKTDCMELVTYAYQVKCVLCLRLEGYEEFVWRNETEKASKEKCE